MSLKLDINPKVQLFVLMTGLQMTNANTSSIKKFSHLLFEIELI